MGLLCPTGALLLGAGWASSAEPDWLGAEMSTRRLILTALLCGLAILVAFAVQLLIAL